MPSHNNKGSFFYCKCNISWLRCSIGSCICLIKKCHAFQIDFPYFEHDRKQCFRTFFIADFEQCFAEEAIHFGIFIIQNICISYSSVLPHGDWQLLQSGTSLSFSSLTFCIIFLIAALSKFTFVTVVNSLSIMVCHVFLETVAVSSIALARPINEPVSSSCNFAVSAFFHRHRHFLCSWYIPLSVRTENKTCSYPLLYSPFIP